MYKKMAMAAVQTTTEKPAGSEVSCRLTVSLLSYLEKQGLDTTPVFAGLKFTRDYYLNTANWISEDEMILIEKGAMSLSKDESIMYRVGLQLPLLSSLGRLQRMLRFLVGPLVIYRYLPQYSSLFDRITTYEVRVTGDNSVEVSAWRENGGSIRKPQRDYIRGILSGVTAMWNMPPALVQDKLSGIEPETNTDQGKGCITWQVSWENKRSWFYRFKDRIWPSMPGIRSTITELERDFNLLQQRNEELLVQNEQLAKIREIALSADSSKSIDDVYRGVVDQARKIPGMRFLLVLQRDRDKNVFLQYHSKLSADLLLRELKSYGFNIDKYLNPDFLKQIHSAVENNKTAHDYFSNHSVIMLDHISELLGDIIPAPLCDAVQKLSGADKLAIVPVYIDGKEWGSLVTLVQNSVTVQLLEMVASHLAVAAKNVATMQYLEIRNTELAILNEFSIKIANIVDLKKIFEITKSEIQRVFNSEVLCIYTFDDLGANLDLAANCGDPAKILAFHECLETNQAFLDSLISRGKSPYESPAGAKEGDNYPGWPFISSGLHLHDKPYGFIVLGRDNGKQFSETEVSLLTAICHQVSGSIESAKLHEDIVLRMRELEAAKNQIKASEEKLERILESLDVGIVTTDLEGRIVHINEAAVLLHGYTSKSDLIGKDFINLIAFSEKERLSDSRQILSGFSDTKSVEYSFSRRNGSRFLGELNVAKLLDLENNPRGFVLSMSDINERKVAELKLRESEEKYRTIFDSASDALFLLDKKGNILDINQRISDITGYSREEFLGRNITKLNEMMPRSSTAILLKNFVEQMSGNYVPPYEVTLLRKNAQKAYVEVNAVAIKKDGYAVNDLAIMRDITQRKLAEKEVRKKQEIMYRIITSIPNSVIVINRNMEVVLVNNAFCETFKYKKGEAERRNLTEIINVPEFCVMAQNIFSEKNSNRQVEFAYIISNRSRTFVATYMKMSREDVLISISDLTEERQKQEAMYLTDRLVSVGEMASGIAHELNNPLTSVVALSQIVAGEKLPQNIKEDVLAINSEAQRAATVVRNLLSFARKHVPERQHMQVNSIIEDVLQLRSYEHKNNQITVNKIFDNDIPEVMVDYYQMQQVFLNLFLNAEYAMIESHKRGRLTVITQRVNNHIKISLADDGPGIARENMSKIFDPFFTTKEVGKGTGLGLSICYGIIRNHGGKIYAESQVDKGTTFTIELPLN